MPALKFTVSGSKFEHGINSLRGSAVQGLQARQNVASGLYQTMALADLQIKV
jgi:hypothetical protein